MPFDVLRNFVGDVVADALSPSQTFAHLCRRELDDGCVNQLDTVAQSLGNLHFVAEPGIDQQVVLGENLLAAAPLVEQLPVVCPDDQIEIIPVTPGDIKEGDRLVVTGQARLVDGDKLEIVE